MFTSTGIHLYGRSFLWAFTSIGIHLCEPSLLWAFTSIGIHSCEPSLLWAFASMGACIYRCSPLWTFASIGGGFLFRFPAGNCTPTGTLNDGATPLIEHSSETPRFSALLRRKIQPQHAGYTDDLQRMAYLKYICTYRKASEYILIYRNTSGNVLYFGVNFPGKVESQWVQNFLLLSFRAWCLSENVRFVFVKHPRMKSTQRAV